MSGGITPDEPYSPRDLYAIAPEFDPQAALEVWAVARPGRRYEVKQHYERGRYGASVTLYQDGRDPVTAATAGMNSSILAYRVAVQAAILLDSPTHTG